MIPKTKSSNSHLNYYCLDCLKVIVIVQGNVQENAGYLNDYCH